MKEGMKERMNDTHSGFLILDVALLGKEGGGDLLCWLYSQI